MDQEMLDRVVAVTTAEGTLAHRMGIKVLSASGSEVVATMPVAGNTQPFGLLHGGASCVLAETIGSLGAALHAGLGRVVVGIEISATHHRGRQGRGRHRGRHAGARGPDDRHLRDRHYRLGRPPRVHVPADLPDQGPGARPRGQRRRSPARTGSNRQLNRASRARAPHLRGFAP